MDNQNLNLITFKTGDILLLDENRNVVMVVTHDRIFWNQDMPALMKLSPLAGNSSPEKWWQKLWYGITNGIFPVFMVAFVVSVFTTIICLLLRSL